MTDERQPQICDYEGSDYRTAFWEGQGRNYEDRVERQVLRRLLPSAGQRLLELGAGFGRLTDEYNAYSEVVLLDYSYSQLQYARAHYGDSRYVFVAANAYKLPFKPGVFDGATMIRVIHHMADVATVLAQVRRVLTSDAIFILEHANKRNLKAVLRYAMGKQQWSPYTHEPVEFVELNFDFHPAYIAHTLQEAQFALQARIPVSFFRLGLLKDNLPTGLLAGMDRVMQSSGLLYAPSIFTRNLALGSSENNLSLGRVAIFACPECHGNLQLHDEIMTCEACGARYAIREGIYDFKAPLD